MSNIKKPSFSTLKKLDKKNNKCKLLRYKTDRNSQEKANLKNSKKAKFIKKHKIIHSFGNKINSNLGDISLKIDYKQLKSYKDTIKNAHLKLNKELRKYNYSNKEYYIQKIDEIIFDNNKRLVSIFKDYLLWNETSDFLKEYYNLSESLKLLPNMCEYYEGFTFIYPEYAPLEDVLKILKRNIKKKKLILEKYEDNDENSIFNNNYDDSEQISGNIKIKNDRKKNGIKSDEFNRIINEKDMHLDMSKTYSHSKTCFDYKNDNHLKEKEKYNNKTLSSIFSDFLKNDEKIIGNYNYLYNKKNNNNFIDDMEEKKIEKYFYDKNKNKKNKIDKEEYLEKDKKNKKDNNKKEIKNKECNEIEMQKYKLKNIVKMIESTRKIKKINKKYFSENLTNKKENKINVDKSKSKDINKKITTENSPKTIQITTINNINSKKLYTNIDNTPKRRRIIKPITLKFGLNHKIKYNGIFKGINNCSSENMNKLFLSKSKNSKSNNQSKNKAIHRYQLLISKIFKNLPKKQKISINKSTQERNHSEGQPNSLKKNMNLKIKSKDKSQKDKNFIKKFISHHKINTNSYIYNNININNYPSFSSLNKTSSEKMPSLNNKKNNVKKLNIKIKISKQNLNNLNNYSNNLNPFIVNNNSMTYKNSYFEKNKTINLNDYLLLLLSNRINSNGKNKTKLCLLINKAIKKENSNYFNKSLNSVDYKKYKNQSCIGPNNNYNTSTIIKNINNLKNKDNNYQLNTYYKKHMKILTDSNISRNDKITRDYNKEKNSIKLKGIVNKGKNNIKNNNNKKEVITSRDFKNSNTLKINSKRFVNSKIVCSLKKNGINTGKIYKKINYDLGKKKSRDYNNWINAKLNL